MQETPATTAGAIHERPISPEATEAPGAAGDAAPAGAAPAGLDDPRFLQVLSTEHWSLLTARSLAYNEAFTRTGMFLTFLSMSFVGLALIGPPLAFSHDFLVIAAIVLLFDVTVGLLTFVRVGNCNAEDTRAMHAMNRIRHGYIGVVPAAAPYFVSGTSDDVETVVAQYGPPSNSALGDVAYGLSTSLGLVGLVVSLVTGVFGAVAALLFWADWPLPLLVGGMVALAEFVALVIWSYRGALRVLGTLPVAFPREADPASRD
jgi:hypothetical protein